MHGSDGHGFLLVCFMKCILTSINNRQNPLILQNKKGIDSRPDPFRGGAYNLQSISATPRKMGLVLETSVM